ncbi:glycoside hydrolase family 130 protein [Marinoscillum furvescens]|uniref:Putative GH43/DUF377 family glycosyl hydrolase n=1 Tax=Marinoscillum furvescens DSM 4134 TaxID=1122208 RepID=A0A3D9L1Y2_MARFU|nr:hypothetical protein [Marinoscillum furvescens]RED98385.1 putative GH43/DUF377 family glycosyl hydrolase [Marinoscillum furvescens DSM 4134]
MPLTIEKYAQNPIIFPNGKDFRKVVTFNPGAIYDNGKFLLYDRAACTLSPFRTAIGMFESEDGKNFKPVGDQPVFTSEMLGYPEGSVQDARVVKIDEVFYMNYAFQPYGFDCFPTGEGVPFYDTSKYQNWEKCPYPMITRSGIATSLDGVNWEHLCFTSPEDIDDRDHALFPEKIDGKFCLLRRPMDFVGEEYGTDRPGMWITFSEDLFDWSQPKLLATAQEPWEGEKIGAACNPIKTSRGWLVLYHGVDSEIVYRVGALMLDSNDPTKVVARSKDPIMEPTEYYEKCGLVIPNVVFPTSIVEKDGVGYIYYGCCDTSIGLATVAIDDLVNSLFND